MDQFPDFKVTTRVRNMDWIMDSQEHRYCSNPHEITLLFNDDVERNTVYSLVETLAQANHLVGYPWTALKEAFYGEYASSLLIVDYDRLVQAPQKVLPLIYQFLGETKFTHDSGNVSYDTPGFDEALGMHKVRKNVCFEQRPTILTPDLFEKFASLSFWTDTKNRSAKLITIKHVHEVLTDYIAYGNCPN